MWYSGVWHSAGIPMNATVTKIVYIQLDLYYFDYHNSRTRCKRTSNINTFPKLQAVGSWGDHPLLKRSDMNQNESAKGDRDKGLPSVKCESYYMYNYIYIIWTSHFI